MRTLEEIANNPKVATISEILVLVADPFEEFKGRIDQDVNKIVNEELREKFIEGGALISRFRADFVDHISSDPQKSVFDDYHIHTFYQKLRILMENKPAILEGQLKKVWGDIKRGKVKIVEGRRDLAELSHYTHQWRSYEQKRRDLKYFAILKKIDDSGITLYWRENQNKGYPNFLVHGWQEKIKVRKSIVDKMLLTIFQVLDESIEKKGYDRNKFYQSFGTGDFSVQDYFGVKVIGTSWDAKRIIDGLVYDKDSQWAVVCDDGKPKDLKSVKKRDLGILKYLLRCDVIGTTEELMLHVTTFSDFLFDDFFLENSHPRYKLRNDKEQRKYEKQSPKLYARMEESLNGALAFLPR